MGYALYAALPSNPGRHGQCKQRRITTIGLPIVIACEPFVPSKRIPRVSTARLSPEEGSSQAEQFDVEAAEALVLLIRTALCDGSRSNGRFLRELSPRIAKPFVWKLLSM